MGVCTCLCVWALDVLQPSNRTGKISWLCNLLCAGWKVVQDDCDVKQVGVDGHAKTDVPPGGCDTQNHQCSRDKGSMEHGLGKRR